MFNICKTYASIWEVTPQHSTNGKLSVLGKISTARKGQDGNYINSNWWVRFVGACAEQASKLQQKDRIIIKSATVTSEPYEKDGKKTYPLKVTIFEFELVRKNEKPSEENQGGFVPVDIESDSLPF